MNECILEGCAPSPMSSYLKSLGVFRIMAEQFEPDVQMCWKNERAILRTRMSPDMILKNIQDEYKPTPIVTPWSYNKFRKTVTVYNKFTENKRFEPYKITINAMSDILDQFCSTQKIKNLDKKSVDKEKSELLKMCRNMLPDDAVEWLDAVFVIAADKIRYAPVLGTGGNDGNFDMAENFAKRVDRLLNNENNRNESIRWLEATLFGNTISLESTSMIGHNPDASGGPNSSMGFGEAYLSNPWEYVLMLEGAILFGGSIARRYSTSTDKAVFPFTVDTSNMGYATASEGEDGRGEIWTPLWSNPAPYDEIKHVFREGRVQLNGKQAKTGVEFARAITSFGAERGIREFRQFCILKRKGDAYLTVNAGRIRTANEPAVHLISDIDEWYNPIIKKSKTKEAPASLKRLVRSMDDAVMALCKYRKSSYLLDVLVLIGKLERYVTDRGDFKVLQKLSSNWLAESYDGTPEFRLAASIASIKKYEKVGPIRTNLENVEQDKYNMWRVSAGSVHCVWNETDDLLRNMTRVLLRRSIDGKMNNTKQIPINATIPARIDDVMKFLNGYLNLQKMGDLIPPLTMIDLFGQNYPWETESAMRVPVPEVYAVMKLIHPPTIDTIPFGMSVLNLLAAGRITDAYTKAAQTLNSHQIQLRNSKNIGYQSDVILSPVVHRNLMASLLFCLSDHDMEYMQKYVAVSQNEQM